MDNHLPYIVLVHFLSMFGCDSRGLENIDNSLEYRTAPCPESYEHFQQSCYKLYTDRVPRDAASTICNGGNSHLVDIKSEEEQTFVADLLKEDPDIQYRLHKYNNNPKNVGAWIGLKVSLGGDLVWTDGTPLDFTAWDQINGRDEPETACVRMDSRFDFEWGDRNCFHHFSFVCERDSDMKISTTPYVMPHVTTVSAPIDDNHGNITVHASNRNDDGVFAIEIAYPFLTIIVAIVVGLAVYWIYLRKKARNSLSIQPLTPEDTHRHSFNLPYHGYVEIENDHPQPLTHNPPRSILPPNQPPKPDDTTADVRTSLQSNGYIEFKSQHNGKSPTLKPPFSNLPPNHHSKPDDISAADVRTSLQSDGYIEFKSKHGGKTNHMQEMSGDITHTYFNPNKHEFHSASSIKHTYFKSGAQGSKP